MAKDIPYIYGQADTFVLPLTPQGGGDTFQVNPTIAAGDFKIWNPGTSTWDNLTTTPTVISATGPSVLISWSAAEAAYEPFIIWGKDQVGAQWKDVHLYGRMTARSVDDLAVAGDAMDLVNDALDAGAVAASGANEIAAAVGAMFPFPAGSVTFTYTVINSSTLLPMANVEVWVSTDNPATNIIWKGSTDAFGVARDIWGDLPRLDPGTYYFWKHRVGFQDNNLPDTEIVS